MKPWLHACIQWCFVYANCLAVYCKNECDKQRSTSFPKPMAVYITTNNDNIGVNMLIYARDQQGRDAEAPS